MIVAVPFLAVAVIVLLSLSLAAWSRRTARYWLDPDLEEVPVDSPEVAELSNYPDSPLPRLRTWAEENDFELAGFLREVNRDSLLEVWRQRERPTFLLLDPSGDFEFLSVFHGGGGLRTEYYGGGGTSPRIDGWYGQAFTRDSIGGLWTRHARAEEYLMDRGGAEYMRATPSFADWLSEHRIIQSESLHLIDFIILLQLIRPVREFRHVSVPRQHDLGLIRLPNETGAGKET